MRTIGKKVLIMLNGSRWKELPVIASFDSKGNVRPLYLRIEGERYQVLSCVDRGLMVTHHVFDVSIENYGRRVPVTLGFWVKECIWQYCTEA